ncbi:MAG TPA: AMP-binding protein, partial [Rhodothermales bacterium]|nr:AMP-binding protein [Rhodothermales bacterium]
MPETTFPFGQPIVLQPDPQAIAASNLAAFMQRHGVLSYKGLLERAREDVAWFWDAVLKDLDVQFYTPYTAVLEETGDSAFPRWCVGGELNIVHNLLDKWQASETTRTRNALIWECEDGTVRTYTYAELHAEVCRCASALRTRGLGRGDAVGLFMPMTPELLIAFLAVIKIGGIILPLFSGYGPEAVRTRLEDGE